MLQRRHARQDLAPAFELPLLVRFIFLDLDVGLRGRLKIPRQGADLARIATVTTEGSDLLAMGGA
jgi:hypothetical protein